MEGFVDFGKCPDTETNSKEDSESLSEFQKRESEFHRQHKHDSDEELLGYVRRVAEQLGKVPSKKDVPGFTYIKSRFGPWPRVLEKAGLKKPKQDRPQRVKKHDEAAANNKNRARRRKMQFVKMTAK